MRVPATLFVAACCALAACARPAEPAAPPSFEQLARTSLARIEGRLAVPGLKAEVEVLRDEWGVPHIYAQDTDDLFFAQGFVVAQDRLWQMEIWRRTGEGRVAELVGPAGIPHDRLIRLFKYRGPYDDAEWSSYHPEGKRIFTAYAAGVNALIASVGDHLPVEFTLTGTRPEPWTPEQLLQRARVSDSLGDARAELTLAKSVAMLGLQEADRRARTVPADNLAIPDGVERLARHRRGHPGARWRHVRNAAVARDSAAVSRPVGRRGFDGPGRTGRSRRAATTGRSAAR